MNRLPFIWEKFVNEELGAVEQIITFLEQLAFLEVLEPIIGIDSAIHVSTADTDLRMSEEIRFDEPSSMEKFTIYTDWIAEE